MRIWPRSQRPAEPPPPAAAAQRHAPQWPSLPAVQRVLTPIAPVADRDGFVSSLAAHTDPSFLAPLAHLVDPDGPSGRITGLIAPAPSAPAAVAQPRAATGVVQRWPSRWFGGPVISRSVSTDAAVAVAAPSVLIDTTAFDDPTPSDPGPEPGQVHHFAQPPTPTGSGPAATVQRHAPLLADTAPTPRSTAPRPEPAPPLPQRLLSVVTDDPPVQRSLLRAPAPESSARDLPLVSRSVDLDEAPGPAIPEAPTPALAEDARVAEPSQAPAPIEATSEASADAVPAPAPPALDDVSAPTAQRSTLGAAPTPTETAPVHADTHPHSGTESIHVETRPAAAETRTLGVAAPVSIPPVQRSVDAPPPAQSAGAAATSAPAPVERPRKLGLGAPIEHAPTTAAEVETISLQQWAAARDAAPPPPPVIAPTAAPPAVQRSVSAPSADAIPAKPELQRMPDPAADATSGDEWRPIADGPVPSPPPEVESAALLGDRPALLEHFEPDTPAEPTASAPVHSTPTDAAAGHVEPQSTAMSLAPPAPSARPSPASLQRTLSSVEIPDPPAVQRTVGTTAQRPLRLVSSASVQPERPAPAAAGHEVAPSTLSHQQFGTTLQRQAAPTGAPATGTSRTDAARTVAPITDAGSAAVASGIGRRAPDGSVVFDFAPAPDGSGSVQRAVELDEMTVEPTAPASPGESPAADAPAPSAAPTSTAAAAAGAAGPAPAGAAAAGAPNLDELARRLYDPLAARIKAELRLDRERFGLVTDLRRP